MRRNSDVIDKTKKRNVLDPAKAYKNTNKMRVLPPRSSKNMTLIVFVLLHLFLASNMAQHDPTRIIFLYHWKTALDPWPLVTPEGLERKTKKT